MERNAVEKSGVSNLTFSQTAILLNCGLVSGLAQAAVFNPWDRALYLSVINNRNFLNRENFRSPMSGVLQTIAQRTISSGLYFPLEDISVQFLQSLNTNISKSFLMFLAGLLAGSANGIIVNPLASVKYQYWGKIECGNENFWSTSAKMFKTGGFRVFFVGSMATLQRDLIFGGTFAYIRHELFNQSKKDKSGFSTNLIAGSIATILSSPYNYVRNIHYATPPEQKPMTSSEVLYKLFITDISTLELSTKEKLVYLQRRLRIGWGTARVGCGMAFGSMVYNFCLKCANALQN